MLRYIFQYKFSILLIALILLLSLAPSSSLPHTRLWSIPHFDKIVHFLMYAPLCFVTLMESRFTRQRFLTHVLIILGILLVSGMIELLQATLAPSRAAEWADLFANFSGLFAGYLAYRLLGGLRIFRFLKS
jgi:VanZ family protein